MLYLTVVFLLAAALVAIYAAVKNAGLLWISVILLVIVEAMHVLPK